MGIGRGEPSMKNTIRLLSIIIMLALLAGCAPTPTPAPTPLPTATFNPPPTTMPTSEPEPTPTTKMEVPLEQLPATIAAATDFAKAMTDAGMPTTAEQVLGQGLVIEQHEENGNKFEVATSQGYPLMMKMEGGGVESGKNKKFM